MTRNLATLYRPGAPESDRSRYDMPPAPFELVIGGLARPGVSRSAPPTPSRAPQQPVEIVARRAGRIRVRMPLTDSPRLLSITER